MIVDNLMSYYIKLTFVRIMFDYINEKNTKNDILYVTNKIII